MDVRLEEFDFTPKSQAPKYDWNAWADGSIWRIVQGEDFACKTTSMANTLKQRAKRAGMKVRVRILDGDTVVFQFSPGDSQTPSSPTTPIDRVAQQNAPKGPTTMAESTVGAPLRLAPEVVARLGGNGS